MHIKSKVVLIHQNNFTFYVHYSIIKVSDGYLEEYSVRSTSKAHSNGCFVKKNIWFLCVTQYLCLQLNLQAGVEDLYDHSGKDIEKNTSFL